MNNVYVFSKQSVVSHVTIPNLNISQFAKHTYMYNIPIKSSIERDTTRLELQFSTVVAAKARPLISVGNISLRTNQLTTKETNPSKPSIY